MNASFEVTGTTREKLAFYGWTVQTHHVVDDDEADIEPCPTCSAAAHWASMWIMSAPPRPEILFEPRPISYRQEIEYCVELEPCGHEVTHDAGDAAFWVTRREGDKDLISWSQPVVASTGPEPLSTEELDEWAANPERDTHHALGRCWATIDALRHRVDELTEMLANLETEGLLEMGNHPTSSLRYHLHGQTLWPVNPASGMCRGCEQ